MKKHNFKLVCKICFRANKTQTEKPAEKEHCLTHAGEWMPLRIHQATQLEIRPIPTVKSPNSYKFELCRNHQQKKWEQKEHCSRAHNQHELHVWRAEQAICYPRPCPPPHGTGEDGRLVVTVGSTTTFTARVLPR